MINFIEYIGREVNLRKGLKFSADELPSSILREIEAGRKVGIWWFQSDEESTYKIIGRTVFYHYHLASPDGRNEYVYMDVDPSESYTCLSSLGEKVIVRVPELVLAGKRFHQIDDAVHSLILKSVRDSARSTLSRTKGNIPYRTADKVDEILLTKTRDLFSHVFERHVNELFFTRRADTRDHISAPAIFVLESLIRDHQVEPTKAYDAVLFIDPICRDIIREPVSPLPEAVAFPPEVPKAAPELENALSEPYLELTDEAIAARTYSDPLNFHESMAATQRAEDVHQAMLRSINQCLRDRGGYRMLFNKFTDLALSTVASGKLRHIIEIKSITSANIENQISKGLIQLSRQQFIHRGANVQFHLVAEDVAVPPPQYLKSLADRLGVSLHLFDQRLRGLDACNTLYAKLYDSNGSP